MQFTFYLLKYSNISKEIQKRHSTVSDHEHLLEDTKKFKETFQIERSEKIQKGFFLKQESFANFKYLLTTKSESDIVFF